MVKVITYGTYDLLHRGHIRLLERAKELGDYLIVGVTSDDYDKTRGKINVQQSLEERVAAVQSTGIADKVIIEEYEGQKIDDIRRYGIDIFTVGSDWEGYFDYLGEFCKVVYLPRTEGVSSSEIRSAKSSIKLGIVGYSAFLDKFYTECKSVNAIKVVGLCTNDETKVPMICNETNYITCNYESFLNEVDCLYIHSHPILHYQQCKEALMKGKHVLCESPIAKSKIECQELIRLANENGCILMEGIRTAYLTAYSRLLLLLKAGKIGNIASVDATCTSLSTYRNFSEKSMPWGALEAWGPTALLPIFQLLGTNYEGIHSYSSQSKRYPNLDGFTKVDFIFSNSVASIKVGMDIKSESDLIISGTKGYAYIPAPWWKTDYFELRYENASENRRYFYQIDGDGIRYELVQFVSAIRSGNADFYIGRGITEAIADIMEKIEHEVKA